ncbi:serine hydrolase [Kineosporia sp. A_224]|uniref:serine hydrolase domain-containing protein n=1 Tax=Kineosporia sp. A_224 TaxID=1962180 RepID=UPI000B4B5E98|nr:serine hydrolase domain-containing protein [Kineosporia sp. A_224]
MSPDALETAVVPVLDRHAGRHTALVAAVGAGGTTCVLGRGRDERAGVPDGATVLEIGSVTKVFTATLLMLMADAGEVALDEPVEGLLPDGVRMPVRGRPITLLDLVTHRSGLPRLPVRWLLRARGHGDNPYAVFGLDDVWHAAVTTRRRAPGGAPRYSNLGVGLLGHALAHRAGAPWETLVVQRVCLPLGLADTYPGERPEDASRTAGGHDARGRAVPHWDFPVLAAAGALRSTAVDLLAFLRAQGGDGGTALRRAVRATHEPYASRLALEQCAGWMALRRSPGTTERVLWHNGGTGGFRSFVACVPGSDVQVVVLAADARDVDRLGQDLLAAVTS